MAAFTSPCLCQHVGPHLRVAGLSRDCDLGVCVIAGFPRHHERRRPAFSPSTALLHHNQLLFCQEEVAFFGSTVKTVCVVAVDQKRAPHVATTVRKRAASVFKANISKVAGRFTAEVWRRCQGVPRKR